MEKKLLMIILFAAMCTSLLADIQPGYVRTIKRPGKKVQYIENVQIKVKGISGSFRSGKKGRFELELRSLNLKTGSPFSLNSVFRSGYELYDNNLSRVYSPGVPIEIVLKDINQEAKEQQAFAQNIYKGAENNYKKKIDALDKQLRQKEINEEIYQTELLKYQELFDKYQTNIDVIAKRYAGLDYMNIDPMTEAINEAFGNGDFELADSLLNTCGSIETQARSIITARGEIDDKIKLGRAIVDEGLGEREQNRKDAERFAELAYAKHLSFLNNFQNDSAAYYLELRAQLVPDNSLYQDDAGEFISKYLADYEKALEYLNKALNFDVNLRGEEHADVASRYNNIGVIYYWQRNYVKALECHEKALNIRLRIFGEMHPEVASSYNNIGLVYRSQGDYVKALEYYGKALNTMIKVFDEMHPDIATCYNNIGVIYDSQGDYVKALECYEKALNIKLKLFGEMHPDIATTNNNIGCIYYMQGNYVKALEYYEKALNIRLRIFGEMHPDVATSYNNIGLAYDWKCDYVKALEYYEKALNIWLRKFGEMHPDIAVCYNNIGVIYDLQGDYVKALEYYEKALNIRLRIFGEMHLDVATSYNNIGCIYYMQGNYVKALEYYEKALNIWLRILGEMHPDVITIKDSIEKVKNKIKDN